MVDNNGNTTMRRTTVAELACSQITRPADSYNLRHRHRPSMTRMLEELRYSQNRAARLIAPNFDWNIRGIDIVRGLEWYNVKERFYFLSCCLTYKSLNILAPYYLSDLFSSVSEYHTVLTRNATSNTLQQPRCNNSLYKSFLSVNGSRLWKN